MARDSVFYKIVSKEDSYTQLLCNLMARFPDFRSRILGRFLNGDRASGIAAHEIRTQKPLPGYGRPDIEISTDDFYALMEVKVRLRRGLTENQESTPSEDGERKSYLHFLRTVKRREKWLVYLVPARWQYRPSLEQSVEQIKSDPQWAGIDLKILYWETVFRSIKFDDDPLLQEFRKLLEDDYGPMFSTEEVTLMFSKNFAIALTGVAKMEALIREIQKKAAEKCGDRYYFEWERNECSSYGFYLNSKNMKNGSLLWVGMWAEASEETEAPLCFGVRDCWGPAATAFRDGYKGNQVRVDDEWAVGWVSQEDLESEERVDRVWAQLAKVIDTVTPSPIQGEFVPAGT